MIRAFEYVCPQPIVMEARAQPKAWHLAKFVRQTREEGCRTLERARCRSWSQHRGSLADGAVMGGRRAASWWEREVDVGRGVTSLLDGAGWIVACGL